MSGALRISRLKALVWLVISLWLEGPAPASVAASLPAKPNIIIILSDDLGHGDLSCYRQEANFHDSPAHTPHIDSLAAQGVKFSQAYAAQMCSPSRASLLTGRYAQRFGFYENQDADAGLPKSEVTLAELLQSHGYATACIGKWHVGHRPGHRPLDRGFERFYGFLGAAHDYFKPGVGTDTEGPIHEGSFIWDQDQPVTSMKYLTDQLGEVAVTFIDQSQRARKPFFLYLAFNAPHAPAQPKPEIEREMARLPGVQNQARNAARAMIDSLDQNVGRLMRELFLRGIDRQTLVVFASDNGGNEYEFADGIRSVQHNGGLRGRKFLLWEGGIRVPLILRWKGTLPEGKVFTGLCNLFDVFATAASAASAPIPPGRQLDSVDLLPYARGEKTGDPHQTLHATFMPSRDEWCVRIGDWKLIRGQDSLRAGTVGKAGGAKSPIVTGLYRISDDPFERRNLLAEFPEKAAMLREAHQRFIASCPPSLGQASKRPAPGR